jgi:hypothetical protein
MLNALKRSALNIVRGAGYEIRKIPQHVVVENAPSPVPQIHQEQVPDRAAPIPDPVIPPVIPDDAPPLPDRDLYLKLYGPDTFDRRPFLNIGAGNFRHPAWRNVDFDTEAYGADVTGNTDIAHDLSAMVPLPIADASIDAVFYQPHGRAHPGPARCLPLLRRTPSPEARRLFSDHLS